MSPGFVGVALRGPVNEPTPVISWADYERRFGGLEPNVSGRDRLLPYAVQAFFAQGGRRAWVVRVAPVGRCRRADADAGDGAVRTGARVTPVATGLASPGSWRPRTRETWGTALEIRLDFAVSRPSLQPVCLPKISWRCPTGPRPDSSLLRIRYGECSDRRVPLGPDVTSRHSDGTGWWSLDRSPPHSPEGRRVLDDAAARGGGHRNPGGHATRRRAARSGAHRRLGLHPGHPRFPPDVLPPGVAPGPHSRRLDGTAAARPSAGRLDDKLGPPRPRTAAIG